MVSDRWSLKVHSFQKLYNIQLKAVERLHFQYTTCPMYYAIANKPYGLHEKGRSYNDISGRPFFASLLIFLCSSIVIFLLKWAAHPTWYFPIFSSWQISAAAFVLVHFRCHTSLVELKTSNAWSLQGQTTLNRTYVLSLVDITTFVRMNKESI